MDEKMRVMTERPLNAETPTESLRTWITDNEVFFKRNQGQFPDAPINLAECAGIREQRCAGTCRYGPN